VIGELFEGLVGTTEPCGDPAANAAGANDIARPAVASAVHATALPMILRGFEFMRIASSFR
jgi:hypothetical protein